MFPVYTDRLHHAVVPRFLAISYSERRRLSCVPSSKIGESFSLDKMERVESRPDTFSPSSLNLPHLSSLLLQMGARGTEEEGRSRRRRGRDRNDT